jgi:glycosyltransferase involved in cell wall biosynthesis
MNVSVVTPALNERASIGALIESLLSQTVPPSEIVVADGGSTDGTRELLDELAAADARVRVVDGPGGISENRNAAIAAAGHEIVACIDAGCIAEPDWLEKITAPFARGEDWVSGFYLPRGATLRSTCAGLALMSVREEVNPDYITPPGASQAFRKKVWYRVGGFPEGMAAAEDTLFGERARAAGFKPFFEGDALIQWRPPESMTEMVRKAFRWGLGDGRAGLRGGAYKKILLGYWGSVLAAPAVALIAWWLVPIVLIPLVVTVARRTRFKYRWADGAGKYVLIPIAHTLQLLSQSLGWLVGSRRA